MNFKQTSSIVNHHRIIVGTFVRQCNDYGFTGIVFVNNRNSSAYKFVFSPPQLLLFLYSKLFFSPENNEGHNDVNRANKKCGSGRIEDHFIPIILWIDRNSDIVTIPCDRS